MNVYFANGTNIVVGCDNEKDSYYFCQKDGNECCNKDTCKIPSHPVSFQKEQNEMTRSGFIGKDQEKTKEEHK